MSEGTLTLGPMSARKRERLAQKPGQQLLTVSSLPVQRPPADEGYHDDFGGLSDDDFPVPQSWADMARAGGNPLQAVEQVYLELKYFEGQLQDVVAEARRQGCTWDELGLLLGLSKQGAQQRFGGARRSRVPQ